MSTDESNATDWDAVGYCLASVYRQRVLRALNDDPAMPSELREELDIDMAAVSEQIGNLRERGLVQLLVPEETRKGRIYGLTEKGRQVHEEVESR